VYLLHRCSVLANFEAVVELRKSSIEGDDIEVPRPRRRRRRDRAVGMVWRRRRRRVGWVWGGSVSVLSGIGIWGGGYPSPEIFLGILCERMHFGALFTEEYQ